MTLSRTKLMAGLLGLSVGGLAMCCAQTTPVLPQPVPQKTTTPDPIPLNLTPPTINLKSITEKEREIEIVLPIITSPITDIFPVKAEEKKAEPKKSEVKKEEAEKAPAKEFELPGIGGLYEPPAPTKAPDKKVEPAKIEVSPTPISKPVVFDLAPPPPSVPKTEPVKGLEEKVPEGFSSPKAIDVPKSETKAPAKLIVTETPKPESVKPESGKLKLLLRMGSGSPRFEIRHVETTELLFKVYGEKIEIQSNPEGKSSPLAGVTASGKVKFTGPGVEGTCDSLTLLSGTGEVLMKGNVQLKTKTGRTWSELAAEKMMYQIGATGLKTVNVTPTNYRE
jgi:hypothetical protein